MLKQTHLALACLICFSLFAFLTVGLTHSARAASDDCCDPANPPTGGCPAVPTALGGTKMAGYNTGNPNGDFQIKYQNNTSQAVQKKGIARFNTIMDVDKIDAKAHYCWDAIKALFESIAITGNPKAILWAAIKLLISNAVLAALEAACQFAKGAISGVLGLFTLFSSRLCLPIPRLNIPHFPLPAFGTGAHCQGINLSPVGITPPGTGKGKKEPLLADIWQEDAAIETSADALSGQLINQK